MLAKNPIYIASILFLAAIGVLYLDNNTQLFLTINGNTSQFIDEIWIGITTLGNKAVALCLVLILFWKKQFLLRASLIAAAFATAISQGMKPLIALDRPTSVLDPAAFHSIGEALSSYSFPSAHAIATFAIFGSIAFYYKSAWISLLVLLVASLIAISRIAVGAHWPIDILVGAALGWVCAWLGNYLIDADLWRDNNFWNYLTYLIYLPIAGYLFWKESHFAEMILIEKGLAVITIITILLALLWLIRGGNKEPISLAGWLS